MLTLTDIEKCYSQIKWDIERNLRHGNVARTIRLMDTYAGVAQLINDRFRDDDIEHWMEELAETQLGIVTCTADKDSKRIVFYDQIGSTVCLGLQYIRGLIANGYEVLYIFESPIYKVNSNLLAELENNHIRYLVYNSDIKNNNKLLALARKIQQEIVDFNPARLIVHAPAFGALGCVVLYSLRGVVRYRIVPGDHHFYLGCGCTDYFFEFRNFGIKVAVEQRHIDKKQLFKLPYYPIVDRFVEFQGFPAGVEGKICFVASGGTYKFHGSDWFWEFSKWLLTTYKEAVLLFIGNVTPSISAFIEREYLEGRFIPLGYRKDFASCINQVDVLINSYPYSGGLICQTAAYFKKPILSFFKEKESLTRSLRALFGAEEMGTSISFSDEKALTVYVDKLVNDASFRISEGERIHSMLQTKEKFDELLGEILCEALPSNVSVTDKYCNIEERIRTYVKLQNTFTPSMLVPLIRCYGWRLPFKLSGLSSFVWSNRSFFMRRVCVEWIKHFPKPVQDALRKKYQKSL